MIRQRRKSRASHAVRTQTSRECDDVLACLVVVAEVFRRMSVRSRSFTQCRRYVGSAAQKEKSAMRSLCSLRIMVALLSALITTGAAAQQPARLEVIVFAGGFNWPIWVAQ